MWVGNSKNFLGNYLLFIWFDTIKKKKKKKKKLHILYIIRKMYDYDSIWLIYFCWFIIIVQ